MYSRLPVWLLLSLLLSACIAPDTGTGTEPIRDSYPVDEIWIVNNLSESISVCNGNRLSSGTSPWTANHCLLTGSVPNRLYFHQGLGYTINSYGNSITVFNPNTAKNEASIPLGNGHNPWAAAFCSRSGREFAIVTGFLSDRLLIVNLSSEEVIKEIPITVPAASPDYRARPEGIVIMNDRAYFTCTGWSFSANTFREGYLGILDISPTSPSNWISVAYIATATNPQSLFAVPENNQIHILATGINGKNDGTIQIYSTDSGMITTNLPCGGSPYRFASGTGGTTYLAGGSRLMAYNRLTLQLTRGYTNPLYAGTANDYLPAAAVDTNNNRLYLADFANDKILQLDPASGVLIKESPSGDGPLDLQYRRQF